MNIKKSILRIGLLMIFALAVTTVRAQDINPIPYTAPSLTISPDARAGGMGDAGVASAADVYSQHWNPAKYPFALSKGGFGLTYTPWLKKVVNDISMFYVSGYYKLGSQDNQAISASIRYFSLGNINVHDAGGIMKTSVAPYEFAIDVAYSRKLSSTFSGAVAFRYIRADYAGADDEGSPGGTFAADLAGYNESYFSLGNTEYLLGLGFNISNIGGKISNNDGMTSSFIPTNLRLGASLMLPLNQMSTLSFNVDLNKLLVPTPPVQGDLTTDEFEKKKEKYYDTSPIKGIFKSFGDAPGGFKEEMKEISVGIGAEYDYDNKFKVRTGYFHESKMKGNRRYASFGVGFHMSAFQIDVAYLLSTAQSNPMDQTLRFALGFDVEGIRNLFNKR